LQRRLTEMQQVMECLLVKIDANQERLEGEMNSM
jgi:hypothetical protein